MDSLQLPEVKSSVIWLIACRLPTGDQDTDSVDCEVELSVGRLVWCALCSARMTASNMEHGGNAPEKNFNAKDERKVGLQLSWPKRNIFDMRNFVKLGNTSR